MTMMWQMPCARAAAAIVELLMRCCAATARLADSCQQHECMAGVVCCCTIRRMYLHVAPCFRLKWWAEMAAGPAGHASSLAMANYTSQCIYPTFDTWASLELSGLAMSGTGGPGKAVEATYIQNRRRVNVGTWYVQ